MKYYFKKDLKENKIISVVGLAKNTGKTTTLNRLIKESEEIYKKIAILSTGRDGEEFDVFTNKDKPRILAEEGTFFVTTEESLNKCTAGTKVCKVTKYITSMGRVLVVLVTKSGYIEVAGPVSVSETIDLIKLLNQKYKVKRVLIDGSINRTAIITSRVGCGVILATGAVLGELEDVIHETRLKVEILQFPVVKPNIGKLIENNENKGGTILFEKERIAAILDGTLNTSLDNVMNLVTANTDYIYTTGAVSDIHLETLMKKKGNMEITAEDTSKIHIAERALRKWTAKGCSISVKNKIKLCAVTCNPYNPMGRGFEPKNFLEVMKKNIKIPVYDVMIN